jgi:hypothetical protein
MIEFALTLPILVLILMGIFDLGFAVYADNTLTLSSREGARVGIVNPNEGAIQQRVIDTAQGLRLSTPQVTVSYPPGGRSRGFPVTVTASYNWTPITPIIGDFLGGAGFLVLKGSSSMVVECKGGLTC